MKFGLSVSTILHTIFLVLGLFSLSMPRVLSVADVDALSIDIIPISEFTQTVTGDKEASEEIAPSPKPTQKQEENEDAIHIGDGTKDIESDSDSDAPSRQSARTTASAPEPEPAPQSDSKPDLTEVIEQSPEPAPAEPQRVELPDQVPLPTARPKREESQQRVVDEQDPDESATIAALLDRQKASSGGLKRASDEAGLGTDRGTNDSILSQSELDALRGQIQKCWNVGALVGSEDADTLRAKVEFSLHPDGTISTPPSVDASGGSIHSQRAFAGGAKRAIVRCAPYDLPAGKYEEWSDIVVYFSLKDML